MTYRQRLSLFIFIDSCIIITAVLISRMLVDSNFYNFTPLIISTIGLLTVHLFFSFLLNLYKKAWEYASIGELIIILKTVTYSIIVIAAIQFIILQAVYLRALAIIWMINLPADL